MQTRNARFLKRNKSEEKLKKKKNNNNNGCNTCLIVFALILVATISFVVVVTMPNKDASLRDKLKLVTDIFKSPIESNALESVSTNPAVIVSPTTPPTGTPIAKPLSTVKSKVNVDLTKNEIHFIHIPKCGGTTMTAILRQIQCAKDPIKNSDCCTNPGFCDWHAMRRCAAIQGCINHFPNRKLIYKPMPSIAVFRDPISRILSAWFYRGHSPNLDFFQVRPEFKEISQGKRPKATFAEYVEMHEYHNIQTRMLGADSFPYRNITIDEEIYQKAVDAVDHLFFVGLQEEFESTSLALARELNVTVALDIKNERDNTGNSGIAQQKKDIKNNEALMRRLREVNQYDIRLFKLVTEKFCAMIQRYPDLQQKVAARGKTVCNWR